MNRRQLLGGVGALVGGAALGGIAGAGVTEVGLGSALGRASREKQDLRLVVNRLAQAATSGGGVNRKMMVDPITGKPTVPLEEVFTFSRNHAMCRVDTNHAAFRMKTFSMGEVVIEPHQFFMAMTATSVDRFHVETLPDGRRKATLEGGLNCATEVAQSDLTFGSRTIGEPADYKVEAIDASSVAATTGGGDSFVYTAIFDRNKAPLNHAIFGPEAAFTGTLVAGRIVIVDPGAPMAGLR